MMHINAYGRLGQDPKRISTTTGTPMVVGSIAVDLRDNRGGDDDPEWIGVAAFGKRAAVLEAMRKGDPICVMGRAQVRKWQTGNEERRQLQVVADAIMSPGVPAATAKESAPPPPAEAAPAPALDDEIPF